MENMYMDLSDRVAEVLDEYGILYGDIVDNGDGTCNIVGVDESEWDDVVDAIENELGLEVEVPDFDHDEYDDELIVRESLKEPKEQVDKSLKEGKSFKDLTIEEMFFEVAGKKFKVFDKDGHFTKEAYELYDKVANRYGDIDKFDALCGEEGCFEDDEDIQYPSNESLKEEQKGFVTFLNLECGVLLPEDHPEFKDYSVAYDHKHGYYDETYLNSLEGDLEILKESGLKYIKEGVNGTYAILTKVDVQGSMEDDYIQDAIKDIEDGMYIDNSVEFLDGEQFKASNVIWSAYKDENGEIIENFVDTSVTEGCKKELKEYNLPKDAKPYKTCGDKEYYIATFDDTDRAMGGTKATHTIVTKKVGGDFDLGSASGLDFNSEEEAKKWIDDACSLKENVSDEVASKLQALYDEGNVYFDIAKDKDGDDFLIVDGWEDVRKIQKALKPDFEPKDEYDTSVLDEIFDNGYAWGFRDEYSKCDRCGNVIRTEADSYSWVPDFFVDYDNGEIICGDCVRENPKEYLETLYNNPEKANTILSAQDLIDNGFERIGEDYEDGWYDRHDSPEEILNKALEAHPNGVFIFHISGQGQFATQFELWGADLDLDESKKKDIKEGENFEKVTDHKVEIHHANGDVDIKFFDTHEEACDAYDKASVGGDIVKVCRYSADECEEVKELEESLKESYKDNDIIEFPEESILSTMTFGDLVDMKIEQIYSGALDDIDDLEREYGKDTPELRDVILDIARQEAIDDIKFYNGHKAKKEAKR